MTIDNVGAQQGQRYSTLDDLKMRPSRNRRMRPPDMRVLDSMPGRVPLKAPEPEKAAKRESRLGFRSFFGRSKASKVDLHQLNELHAAESTQQPYERTETAASIWHPIPAEHDNARLQTPVSPDERPPTSDQRSIPDNSTINPQSKRRSFMPTWEPPTLFQAYPQALRYAHLPAHTQAEALLRAQAKSPGAEVPVTFNEKPKKRQWRDSMMSKSSWTNKVYVLLPLGYLVQYAGDGDFQRLPEKVLRLGKDSVAFASDLVPGRHWVIQVSSMGAGEGMVLGQDPTKSLFDRLRGPERRTATDMLMVFESADEMKAWITALRAEIERLGGRQSLSETGTPITETQEVGLKARPSQRTLVPQDFPTHAEVIHTVASPFAHGNVEHSELNSNLDDVREDSFDEVSMSNSYVSNGERQLDDLRHSGGHRLSLISLGQMFTASESSPSASPLRDSFGSQISGKAEEQPSPPVTEQPYIETRTRSNSTMTHERQWSWQSNSSVVLHRLPGQQAGDMASRSTPNFSLPHAANRRRSGLLTPDASGTSSPTQPSRVVPPRRLRRPPPPTLGTSRPLSIVADTPSPNTASPAYNPWNVPAEAAPAPEMSDITREQQTREERIHHDESPPRTVVQPPRRVSPRKYASTNTLRPAPDESLPPSQPDFTLFPAIPQRVSSLEKSKFRTDQAAIPPRSSSSMGFRQPAPLMHLNAAPKRASMLDQRTSISPQDFDHDGHIASAITQGLIRQSIQPRSRASTAASIRSSVAGSAQPTQQSPTSNADAVGTTGATSIAVQKALEVRRLSLSEVLPPPAPPPTRALPPVPKGHVKKGSRVSEVKVVMCEGSV